MGTAALRLLESLGDPHPWRASYIATSRVRLQIEGYSGKEKIVCPNFPLRLSLFGQYPSNGCNSDPLCPIRSGGCIHLPSSVVAGTRNADTTELHLIRMGIPQGMASSGEDE